MHAATDWVLAVNTSIQFFHNKANLFIFLGVKMAKWFSQEKHRPIKKEKNSDLLLIFSIYDF